MEFSEVFINFLAILKQSIKLFLKNWKLLASIAILSQFLLSISVLLLSYVVKSLYSDMNYAFMEPYRTPTTTTSFNSSQSTALKNGLKYFALLLVVEIAFIFLFVIISNFSSVATILISVVSCGEKTLSSQDLISKIRKTWTRVLVTGFSISRNKRMQYWILVGLLGTIPWLMNPNLITLLISIFVGVIASIFHLYSIVDWMLAMIVSVVEESYKGKEALEKSEQLIEGQKIQGFLLNVLINFLVLVSFLCYWIVLRDKWILNLTAFGLFIVNIASLAKMFGLVTYTVLYCECKKRCGEEIEILGIIEYTKLSNEIHQIV